MSKFGAVLALLAVREHAARHACHQLGAGDQRERVALGLAVADKVARGFEHKPVLSLLRRRKVGLLLGDRSAGGQAGDDEGCG